jgi:hypothetical protein
MRRHPRRALAPTLDGCLLEDRVVLSTGAPGATLAALRNAVPVQVRSVTPTAGTLTSRQLSQNLQREFRAAYADLQRNVQGVLQQFDEDTGGEWTQEDLDALRGQIRGLNNATAYRLLAQADVLPGGQRLADTIQTLTIDTRFRNSIENRLCRVFQNPRLTSDFPTLQRSIDRELRQAQLGADFHLNGYLRTANFDRLSYDVQTGRSIPLQQFIGQNIARQYGSGLAQVARGFPRYSNEFLFSGDTDPDPTTVKTFANVTNAALGSLAYRLNSSLRLIPGATTALTPGLQDAFFGAGDTSFATGLGGLTGTGNVYNGAGTGLFDSLYGSTVNNINSYFGLSPVTNPTLPTNSFLNPSLGTFNNYGNGFNMGYGTGTVGYGINPTNALGQDPFTGGFYSGINAGLTGSGFSAPVGTWDPFGTGGFGGGGPIGGGPIGQPF